MLKIHFLNVGHGDCTFIELPSGRLMMIDINNSKVLPEEDKVALARNLGLDRWSFSALALAENKYGAKLNKTWEDYYKSLLVDPVDYYREKFNGRAVFRYIQTHPDMDHMSGIYRFFRQEKIPVENFWDTKHDKKLTEEELDVSPYESIDWIMYELMQLGHIDDEVKVKTIYNYQGAEGSYWDEDGISILSPTPELIKLANECGSYNNVSYVLKISYGGRSIILPGDAEAAAWTQIIQSHTEEELRCDILKASHHGRESGYHREAVTIINPSVVVCSVGKKPNTDASDEYASHGAKVLSTRYNGTMTATMWFDGEVWVDDHKGSRVAALPPIGA